MTASHLSKRGKLIETNSNNQKAVLKMGENKKVNRKMGETTSQMLLLHKDINSSQYSNMFLPGQTAGLIQERLGTAQTNLTVQDDSLMNQTNYISHFKRAAGDPIVRITKSSENPAREKLAQKSAGLLRGNQKNKFGRDASIN